MVAGPLGLYAFLNENKILHGTVLGGGSNFLVAALGFLQRR